jgi:hypothetical protein
MKKNWMLVQQGMKNLEKLKKIESMQNMLPSSWFCWW